MLGQIDGVTGTGMLGFIQFGAVAGGAAAPDAVVGGCGGNENACPITPPVSGGAASGGAARGGSSGPAPPQP